MNGILKTGFIGAILLRESVSFSKLPMDDGKDDEEEDEFMELGSARKMPVAANVEKQIQESEKELEEEIKKVKEKRVGDKRESQDRLSSDEDEKN